MATTKSKNFKAGDNIWFSGDHLCMIGYREKKYLCDFYTVRRSSDCTMARESFFHAPATPMVTRPMLRMCQKQFLLKSESIFGSQ